MEAGLSLPVRRALRLDAAVGARLAVGGLVAVSVVVRIALAWRRVTPHYFPDEYLYAELGRSFAAGHGALVRGSGAGFPALLQSLVTAPAWLVHDTATAFRVAQAIDCVAMSLAAIPAYVLARQLRLGRGAALAVAAFALAVPDTLYSSWLVAEPVAYPLVLGALAAAVAALDRPSLRRQVIFLVLAGLATFARTQFAVLPLCFLVAALVVGARERRVRAVAREQWGVLGALALGAVAVAAVGLGFYGGVLTVGVHPLAWAGSAGRNLLVLAYASGWVLLPAAALGLGALVVRPRTRAESAFGALALTFSVAILGEASALGDVADAQERYTFYVLPLAALCAAVYVSRGRPRRRAHALLAGGLVVLASTVPLSGLAAGQMKAHSPLLAAVYRVELAAGDPGSGALLVSLAAAALALVAVALAWRPRVGGALLVPLAAAVAAATGLGAASFDTDYAHTMRSVFLAPDPAWVDHAHAGAATVLLGPSGSRTDALEQLFWNRSVDRFALLEGAAPPDRFAAPTVVPARDGSLGIRGAVLADGYASTLRFAGAPPVARFGHWTLVRPRGTARLALQATRYDDGWLPPSGRISVWSSHGSVALTLTVPKGESRMTMTFHWPRHVLRVKLAPERPRRVVIPVRTLPFYASYSASSYGFLGTRPVSVRATAPVLTPAP